MGKGKIAAVAVAACMLLQSAGLFGCGGNMKENKQGVYALSDQEFTLSQLAGTDALGRRVEPTGGNIGGKYVAVYFFVWFGTHSQRIYDIGELLEEYEDGVRGNLKSPLWATEGEYYNAEISPNGEFHYWGQPLYGYYDSSDPWVIRRQLEILTYAQVDCLMLDYTNNVVYEKATKAVLDAISELQSAGLDTPRVAFMVSAVNGEHVNSSLRRIHENYLSEEKYRNCLFTGGTDINPSGNPLVVGKMDAVSPDLLEGIWMKNLQWHGVAYDENNYPAMSEQVYQENHNGYMSVTTEVYSPAHDVTEISWCTDPYLYPERDLIRGRGWTPGDTDNGTDPDKVAAGACFQMQWDTVFSDSGVKFLQVQTWNEWAAQKQSDLVKPYHTAKRAVFVDTFNEPFSRDIEPVAGRLKDNYYMQLVENIRRFKGKSADGAAAHGRKTIDIYEGFAPWKDVPGNYLDLDGETVPRNYKSVDPQIVYRDDSARNDIVRLKIANDGEQLYVMAETKKDVTAHREGDKSWMNLYLAAGGTGGWENYDYIVNALPAADGTTSVERFCGERRETVGKARYHVEGNRIFFAVALSVFGGKSGDTIEIKATDNVAEGDIMNFYISGECAPAGRLNYAYRLA